MHLKEIIEVIKRRRVRLNVTQEMLADLSGVGLRTIKKFESGQANPTLSTLQKIANTLGLEISLKIKENIE
jgi:transcriptional regulator with XRE-family HTH domain